MKWLTILAGLAASCACERPAPNETAEATECAELLIFDPARAAADGAKVAAGEPYLLGVYGFTVDVPSRTRSAMPVRMIEGTSDDECEQLNARTREYAKRFNEAVQASARL